MNCNKCTAKMKMAKNGRGILIKLGVAGDKVEVQNADLYECPDCAETALSGFGEPYDMAAERFQLTQQMGKLKIIDMS